MFGFGRKTWDIYDDVIGAYGGKVNQIFSIGGDQDLGAEKPKKESFQTSCNLYGPFKLEKDKIKHQVKLPKYIGSVNNDRSW
jgi:hypothetical protein